MNKKIVLMYLKMIIAAIVATIGIWLILCYLLLFGDRVADDNLPQYLIWSVEENVNIDEIITVDDDFIKKLDEGNIWMQILSDDGSVLYEYNVPQKIPQKYSLFDLVEYSMKSDQIEGYTLYTMQFQSKQCYGVVLGCDSDDISKDSYSFKNNGVNVFLAVIILLVATAITVVVMSSFLFSKKISQPVADIIDDINKIEKGKLIIIDNDRNDLFKNVFVKLTKLQQSLNENEKMREEWIANISHDLKTPLSTIRGYAEMMKDKKYTFSDEQIQLYAGEIYKAEGNMETLIADLRISQKLKEGKVVTNKEVIDVVDVLKECIMELDDNLVADSEIVFEVTKEIKCNCDKVLLKRCLQNIISNAFIHNREKIILQIDAYMDEGTVHICIKDNGKGMSEEELKHIFERYYRGTSSNESKGTGLGLAIAKEIVLIHNGKISVKSILGQGTEFNIEL